MMSLQKKPPRENQNRLRELSPEKSGQRKGLTAMYFLDPYDLYKYIQVHRDLFEFSPEEREEKVYDDYVFLR